MDSQHRPIIHLVGERFETFARNEGVETVNRFIGNVRSGLCDDLAGPVALVAGQGLDASDWEAVRSELTRRGLLDRFQLPVQAPEVVPASHVHKRNGENVMLADARRVGPMRLAARLCLSDMNELVTDHVTGQHLSGMVLIEAGRQMIQLATREFVFDGGDDSAHSMILCSLTAAFESYVFPLEVDVEVELTKLPTSKPARMEFSAEVSISQSGARAVRVSATYQVVRARGLARQEGAMATRAIRVHADAERGPAVVPAVPTVAGVTAVPVGSIDPRDAAPLVCPSGVRVPLTS